MAWEPYETWGIETGSIMLKIRILPILYLPGRGDTMITKILPTVLLLWLIEQYGCVISCSRLTFFYYDTLWFSMGETASFFFPYSWVAFHCIHTTLSLSTHSVVHFCCFLMLTMKNCTAVIIHMHISFSISDFLWLGLVPRSGPCLTMLGGIWSGRDWTWLGLTQSRHQLFPFQISPWWLSLTLWREKYERHEK